MIFLDTNVVSETLRKSPDAAVLAWLEKHDAELALSAVVIGELAFGIGKIRPDQRAVLYGDIMGRAVRKGRPMSAPDGMIAAIAGVHDCALATRNTSDFQDAGIALIDPWRG